MAVKVEEMPSLLLNAKLPPDVSMSMYQLLPACEVGGPTDQPSFLSHLKPGLLRSSVRIVPNLRIQPGNRRDEPHNPKPNDVPATAFFAEGRSQSPPTL